MWMKIWKGLKTQSAAIKTALWKYKSIVETMNPLAPIPEWKDIMSYTFISEFDLLKHSYSNNDIQSQLWCDLINREIAAKHFKVLCAWEEITFLNVEIKCLYTWICNEFVFITKHIDNLKQVDPLLSLELQRYKGFRSHVHTTHLLWIWEIHNLPGYIGSLKPGRVKHIVAQTDTIRVDPDNDTAVEREITTEHEGEDEESQTIVEQIAKLEERQDKDELILLEILIGRTQDNVIADKQLNEDIAQMANILQDTQPHQSVAPVLKSRQQLWDVVPEHMLNRICF